MQQAKAKPTAVIHNWMCNMMAYI